LRYSEGDNALRECLAVGIPINEEQKNEVLAFWEPYLFNKYAKKSFDPRWFDVYNRTNVFDFDLKYYIPNGYYYRIVDTFFSNTETGPVLDDKNLYDLYFHDAPQPKTICRKIDDIYLDAGFHIISAKTALKLCMDAGRVIIKSSVDSMAGMGVDYYDSSHSDKDNLVGLLKGRKTALVQEVVKQHKILADFNDSCVNTLRLVTLLFEGEVHVVASVIIMGGKNAKTNHLHSGGIVCGILPNGQLRDTAFDGKLNMYKAHPNGIVFSEVVIPNYAKCVSLVKELAPRFSGNSRLIGWDLTIGENGEPIIIETNLYFGGSVQIADGPVFGDLTPRVLDYIKKKSL
jgi:hypothetical protein